LPESTTSGMGVARISGKSKPVTTVVLNDREAAQRISELEGELSVALASQEDERIAHDETKEMISQLGEEINKLEDRLKQEQNTLQEMEKVVLQNQAAENSTEREYQEKLAQLHGTKEAWSEALRKAEGMISQRDEKISRLSRTVFSLIVVSGLLIGLVVAVIIAYVF